MSMSCVILTNRHLDDTDAWQRSLDECGFALALKPGENCPIVELSGHLSATWRDHEAGFECYPGGEDDVRAFIEDNEEFDFGGPWSCALDLTYWGYAGIVGSMMVAAAYAKATGGIVFEGESGEILDVEAVIAHAREREEQMWTAMQAKQP